MEKIKTTYNLFFLILSIFILILFTGCSLICLDKTEPDKKFFSFNEITNNNFSKIPTKISDKIVLMEFTTASEFKGNQFIYKKNNYYIRDYYNRFVTPPEKMIQTQFTKWFNIKKTQESLSGFVLKSEILEIYCARTDRTSSSAIIKIRFSLIDYVETEKIIIQKNLYSEVKFNNFTPDNLIIAWTKCLKNIFISLESDLFNCIL